MFLVARTTRTPKHGRPTSRKKRKRLAHAQGKSQAKDDNIDDLWEIVRPRPLGVPKPKPPPALPLSPSLLAALTAEIQAKYNQQPVTSALLADCILMGLRLYFGVKP